MKLTRKCLRAVLPTVILTISVVCLGVDRFNVIECRLIWLRCIITVSVELLLISLSLNSIIWYNPILVTGFPSAGIPPASIAVEGKKNVAETWSLFGSHFSQGFAAAVTFSYVHHYLLSKETKSARLSMVPTVQISPKGYQIYLYDCLQDVMLVNNFFLVSGVFHISMGIFSSPSVFFFNQFGFKSCKMYENFWL